MEITEQQQKRLDKLALLSKGKTIDEVSKDTPIIRELIDLDEKIDSVAENTDLKLTELDQKIDDKELTLTPSQVSEIAGEAKELIDTNQIALKSASLVEIPVSKIAEQASRLVKVPTPPPPINVDKVKREIVKDIVSYTDEAIRHTKEDNLSLIESTKEAILKKIPVIKDIKPEVIKDIIKDSGYEVRDSLELLPRGEDGEPDERLSAEAIKGLEEYIKKYPRHTTTAIIARYLAQIGDVVITNVANGDVLKYQSSTNTWINGAATASTISLTSGTVDGSNKTFTFSSAPNVICVDQGRFMQQTSSDGTVNWTVVGTTVTLLVAPIFDLFAI